MPVSASAPIRECSTCFFTTRFPGVTIAPDGRCNHCHDNGFARHVKEHVRSDLDGLRVIAEEVRASAPGPYHCLVGASGGLDSSYVVYVVKRLLGLNPLVVRYDSGLGSPQAAANLEALCRSLDLELRVIRSRPGWDRRYVHHFLRAVGESDVAWGVCRFCSYAIASALYSQAVRERVPALFTSYNAYEGKLWLSRAFKIDLLKRSLRRQIPFGVPRMAWHLAQAEHALLRLKLELYAPPISNLLRRSPKSPPIRHITVSRYVPWDVETMVRTLESETGWRAPHASLPMRFDCILEDGHINRTFLHATGLTVHGIIANNLIHDGTRTKAELEPVVRHYDEVIEERQRELDERLRS